METVNSIEESDNKNISDFEISKSPTGIQGLDDITEGGIPNNRPTLLIGNPGSGKTVIALEFIINGIVKFNEPGVFMTFEEKTDELTANIKSFGYDLDKLIAENKLYLEHLYIDQSEIQQTGKFNIEGLFLRLGQAIDKVNAKRVVLDSLDSLFYGLDNSILRSEFIRLFNWFKDKKVTVIVTEEMGNTFFTRNGLVEYITDCVISLDNRLSNQIATRRLRIIKYRGSDHGNNEYPFVIDKNGITVLPVISEALQQKISSEKISSGLKQLDEMLEGKGFYVGSSTLISGSAGTGKTSIAALFANSVCKSNKPVLYCAFEEAPNQIIRNMNSIGISMDSYVESKLLHFYYSRPTLHNLEMHFIAIKKKIKEIKPAVVILDPITNLMTEGPNSDIRSMLTRFVDYLKGEQVTVMFTAAITVGSIARNPSDEGISSMVDNWIMLLDEINGERKRNLRIMKSRGMNHSMDVKAFVISASGIALTETIESEKMNTNSSEKKIKESEISPVEEPKISPVEEPKVLVEI